MTEQEQIAFVDQKVSELMEYFDAVQILVTWESEEGTGNTKDLFRGKGNWYSRRGLAEEFLSRDIAHVHAEELRQVIKPSDEGDTK